MVKPEPGKISLQWWTKFVVLQVFYCGFLQVVAVGVPQPGFGLMVTGYHALAFYIPIVTISLHDRQDQYGVFRTLVVQAFFDVPLVMAGHF